MRFGIALPCTFEDKENTRPYNDADNESDGSSDGPVLYRDDDESDNTYGKCFNYLVVSHNSILK